MRVTAVEDRDRELKQYPRVRLRDLSDGRLQRVPVASGLAAALCQHKLTEGRMQQLSSRPRVDRNQIAHTSHCEQKVAAEEILVQASIELATFLTLGENCRINECRGIIC